MKKDTLLTINFYLIVRKNPLIRQLPAPESIIDHTSPNLLKQHKLTTLSLALTTHLNKEK